MTILHLYSLLPDVLLPALKKTFPSYSAALPPFFHRCRPNPPQLKRHRRGPSADMIAGMKNDLAEIQGTFKSGLSLFSLKFTSNLLQFPREMNDTDDEEEDLDKESDGIVGITEEIVDFVSKISSRPELWTDFPISLPDGN
ncbi:BSD domain-containing protein [Abeliophyllum distichum]|uniref:BSD domain-containing protein n=1 Tax=Abeliophyllum distichum TaxID=126358 RepID=A0ABD1RFX6_9LAMI